MENTVSINQPMPEQPVPQKPAPIDSFFGAIESLLRDPYRVMEQLKQPGSGKLVMLMLANALLCILIYGLVAGTFSGGAQLWASPAKFAGGLLFAALVCSPSLYIFACLAGVRARCVEVVGLVAGLVALLSLLLIGLAPVAWVFSQSTELLPAIGALHLLFWAVGCYFGLRFLHAGFIFFKALRRTWLFFWCLIFMTVMLQMTSALRPMIGTSDTFLPGEKKLFLAHWVDCLSEAMTEKR